MCQTLRDGKAIIIEGQHLDPSMYLQELRGGEPTPQPQPFSVPTSDTPTAASNTTTPLVPDALDATGRQTPPQGQVSTDAPSSPPQGDPTVMLRLSELLGASGSVLRRRTHAGGDASADTLLLRGSGYVATCHWTWC